MVSRALYPPFRPKVAPDSAEEAVLELMQLCWDETPAHRPSFHVIIATLKRLNKGK